MKTSPLPSLILPLRNFFATPQRVDFAALAAAHGIAYELIADWERLADRLCELPTSGVRLLELRCDRKFDAQFRAALLQSIGDFTVAEG